jgi:hypothetical protein
VTGVEMWPAWGWRCGRFVSDGERGFHFLYLLGTSVVDSGGCAGLCYVFIGAAAGEES